MNHTPAQIFMKRSAMSHTTIFVVYNEEFKVVPVGIDLYSVQKTGALTNCPFPSQTCIYASIDHESTYIYNILIKF